jgi:hypothetical protein
MLDRESTMSSSAASIGLPLAIDSRLGAELIRIILPYRVNGRSMVFRDARTPIRLVVDIRTLTVGTGRLG